MWHGASPKALSDFSCSLSKHLLWLFGFPLYLRSTSNCVGLGFGFGPLWSLSFRSSSTLFVFLHPFCFTTRGAINFLSPLQSLFLGSINDMVTLHLFLLFPQLCPPFPLGVDQLGIGILWHIFGDPFQVIGKYFERGTSFYCISTCGGGACKSSSFVDCALFRFYAHPSPRLSAWIKFSFQGSSHALPGLLLPLPHPQPILRLLAHCKLCIL
jgi:hypothetical protein